MAGKKGMKHYGAAIIEEVLRMKAEGKTNRAIAKHFGFEDKYVIKRLVNHYNAKQRKLEIGILPRKRGRPRQSELRNPTGKDQLIKQLTMENELLRSFLLEAGRR
jgi:transposase